MASRCPNPCCDFTYSNSRWLHQHFNSLRGQYCFEVYQALMSASTMSSRQQMGCNMSSMAIYQYRQNNNHRNYQPLSTLHPTFDSTGTSNQEHPMAEALYDNMNNEEILDVNDNDEVVVDNNNDNQTVEESFTYTTHQLIMAKLLSLL